MTYRPGYREIPVKGAEDMARLQSTQKEYNKAFNPVTRTATRSPLIVFNYPGRGTEDQQSPVEYHFPEKGYNAIRPALGALAVES